MGYLLNERHGAAVGVEYVDLEMPAAQAEYAAVLETAEKQLLPYPLVAVNGELKLTGTAHFYQLLPLVEEALRLADSG